MKAFILIPFFLLFYSVIFFFESSFKKDDRYLYLKPPQKYLKHFSLGYKEAISSSLWLRWIQDSDACGQSLLTRNQFNEKYQIKLSEVKLKGSFKYLEKDVCEKGWSYQMLEAITHLSPRFEIAYYSGANHLSIVAEDQEGARLIAHKGIKMFKDNWRLFFLLGYIYLYEFQDPKKASNYIYQAALKGGPSWMYSLSAQIFEKTGKIQIGLSVLHSYLKSLKDPKKRKEVIKRIKELRKMLDE